MSKIPLLVLTTLAVTFAALAVAPDHAWVWRRSGASGNAPFDGKTIELRHNDAQDWSLNCFRRMPVKTGDRFVFTFASESLAGSKGTMTASAVTRRADGEVVNWLYAPVSVSAGEKGRVEFVVPPGVTSVEPRFTGEEPIAARLSQVVFEAKGNVCGADLPTEPVTVANARLAVSVSPVDGALAVTDRRTGRVWIPADLAGVSRPLVTRLVRRDAATVEVGLLDPSDLAPYVATFRLEEGEIAVMVDAQREAESTSPPSGGMRGNFDYPAAFATRKGDRVIVPMNEGIGFPADEPPKTGLWHEGMNSGHGLCMSFFGVVEDRTGAGWMALVETPDDAAMNARPDRTGLLVAGPSWEPCRRAFGYARKMRYVFFNAGGHVRMAKRYRAYAKAKGLLVTFGEKAKTRPRVTDICGAPNLWITGCKDAEGLQVVDDFHRAGWTNLLWSAGGSPAFVTKLAQMKGMLVGRYDIYQDIMDPKHREEVRWWHPDWVTEAFPHDIMWKGPSPAEWTHGWPVEAKKGPRIDCAVLCDRQAPPYARKRIGAEQKEKPYNARFIDTTTASPWRECWNPAHPMTRGESREWKMKLLNVVSGEFGLVCGSETGHEAAVPYCDYFEGMLSLGPYRVDEAGRNMWQVVDDVPERLTKYQVGEAYRLPLWELVYHDCCVAQWYWGDYNNKLPKVWRKRDLFNALYATPPMYLMHSWEWPKLRDRVLESMKTACPAALATAGVEMVDHRFLSEDRTVQQTVFANGVTVTVDFKNDFGGTCDIMRKCTRSTPLRGLD